jgi:hypothetical protein
MIFVLIPLQLYDRRCGLTPASHPPRTTLLAASLACEKETVEQTLVVGACRCVDAAYLKTSRA